MTSSKSNQYNGDAQLLSWYNMAQIKLKRKITDNLRKRAIIASDSINDAMSNIFHDTSNHLWATLFPHHSIHQFNSVFPLFIAPNSIFDDALGKLTKKVDEWRGVHVKAMNERPKDFKKYWTTSDNWWNRYKAEWVGDLFFYPLLRDALEQYTVTLSKAYTADNNTAKELLYFAALKEILYAEITFNRARAQPLILDQAFMKSECLHRFLRDLGHRHNVEWNVPPNDDKHRNRIHVRLYARQWVENISKQKQETYCAHINYILNRRSISYPTSSESTSTSASASAYTMTVDAPNPYQPFRSRHVSECSMRFHPYHRHNNNVCAYHNNYNYNNHNSNDSNEQHMLPSIEAPMPSMPSISSMPSMPSMQSMPSMPSIPSIPSMDSINEVQHNPFIESESRDIDINGVSHSSIFDTESVFGFHEINMEFSPIPIGTDDIFNFSDLEF